MSGRFTALPLLLMLGGCQTTSSTPPAAPTEVVEAPPVETGWRGAIRDEDSTRLARLSEAWTQGLAEARARGFGRQVSAEGDMLEPGAALPRASIPPGSYTCRLIRLGAGPRRQAFTAYPSYFCYVGVDEELLAFTKQTGSERPAGFIWDDGEQRGVFLGSLGMGDETPRAYGEDVRRDLVGVVERVGPFRYRLLFPWPQNGAKLDVLELVPVVPEGGS